MNTPSPLRHPDVTPPPPTTGESLRGLREARRLSQNALARLSGIPQSAISAIENNRIRLGIDRARQLALALRCHPADLVFPDWDR